MLLVTKYLTLMPIFIMEGKTPQGLFINCVMQLTLRKGIMSGHRGIMGVRVYLFWVFVDDPLMLLKDA